MTTHDTRADGLSLEALQIYHHGYSMICKVTRNFDPIGTVDDEWALREQTNAWAREFIAKLPGLTYEAPTPEILAVELLAAVGDFPDSDPALRPLLMQHLEARSTGYERLYDQALDADDQDDDDDHLWT